MKQFAFLSGLLSVGAVLETLAGLGLLVTPSLLVSLLLGSPLSETGLVLARLAGGGLLALGITCAHARATPFARVSLGVAAAFLTYNIVACVTLILAQSFSTNRALLLAAAALHGMLAVGLLASLAVWYRHEAAT